ncbi:clavesin-2-like [Armigeres subalbatus]|uniref:clavesin-2-like n=1 Tax=Armigeres subalbatus TaxID=124917 RepID=UPI002ED52A85
MTAPKVSKSSTNYQPYEFSLSEQYREIAKQELHETDELRSQALLQMRDWIAKNPTIRRCRTDGPFLLRFLRVRKFNHVAACENLVRYLALRQKFADWFQKLDVGDAWVTEMTEDWPILPLGYDDRGRFVVMIKMANFNVERFTNVEQIRLMMMILESYYEEEKMQVAGCVFVFEDTGLTMSHVAQWPLTDMKKFIDAVNHIIPLRIKEVHAVNLPRYAVTVAEICLSFTSEKLKARVHCHRSVDSLTKMVSQSLLPKEYGGVVPIDEFKKSLQKTLVKNRKLILELDQMDVDLAKLTSSWNDFSDSAAEETFGVAGSFRKLNVD